MKTNNWPMREIVARRYYRPKGFPKFTGCVELTLECGHTEFRKRSRDPDRTARCWNCHLDSLMPEPEPDEGWSGPLKTSLRKYDERQQEKKGEDDVLSTTEA